MVYTFRHLGERTQMPWNECKPMDERLRFIPFAPDTVLTMCPE